MSGIIKLTFNPFQENTFIVHNSAKDCWIIDPGNSNMTENNALKNTIEEHGLTPVALLLTHAHLDHVMGNQFVFDTYGLKPEMHREGLPVLDYSAKAAAMYGIPFIDGPAPEKFIEGNSMQLGALQFDVLFTPGHCPGEVSFYNKSEKYCIAGDVLFYGSIGRTDLPGGDYDTLINSIKSELMVLEDDVIIYSGHGPETTVGQERGNNPFLK